MIRLYRPLFIARCIYRRAVFRIKTGEKTICLTFDDGPSPGSTENILQILEKLSVKALFFCCGNLASEKNDLMEKIRSAGHIVGNHGYLHLDGFRTSLKNYINNAVAASQLTSGNFFRPPYGRITPNQYRSLSKSFRIIMWDIMAYDFDKKFKPERSLALLKRKIRPGSIIVLHDTPESNVHAFLEEFIYYCMKEGYRFVLPV
jgi:peptidoglycan/xylan/chitin deacetylase (PgdA/CDA1 family)